MLTIKKNQVEAFEYQAMMRFVKKSILFLEENESEFINNKENIELEKFILKVIQFSESHNIFTQDNVLKLISLKVKYDFSYELSEAGRYILSGTRFSESYRVDKFIELLGSKKQRILISLEDDF